LSLTSCCHLSFDRAALAAACNNIKLRCIMPAHVAVSVTQTYAVMVEDHMGGVHSRYVALSFVPQRDNPVLHFAVQ